MTRSPISQVVAKIAGLGLAALVTVTLLSTVGHLADQQYREAALAQGLEAAPAVQPVMIAKGEQPRI